MRADIPKCRVSFCTRNGVKIKLYGFYCKDRLQFQKMRRFFEKILDIFLLRDYDSN